MVVDLNQQLELFGFIGRALDEKVECLVIGGSAMMFYNAKTNTKDIDLIFINEADLERIKLVLEKSGYEEKTLNIFKRYTIIKRDPYKPRWLQMQDTRIDLFFKKVICFWITDSILNRVKEVHTF